MIGVANDVTSRVNSLPPIPILCVGNKSKKGCVNHKECVWVYATCIEKAQRCVPSHALEYSCKRYNSVSLYLSLSSLLNCIDYRVILAFVGFQLHAFPNIFKPFEICLPLIISCKTLITDTKKSFKPKGKPWQCLQHQHKLVSKFTSQYIQCFHAAYFTIESYHL